jgi:hypothetical protein
VQFHGNDRKAGIYNGGLATIERIEKTFVKARTDTGRVVMWDTATFKEYALGYAGTVYRGQGRTQTDVYALYDNAFAWNARTAYVGLTRHKNRVELYVSRDLARDEIALGKQMARRFRDEASLAWATRDEALARAKERGDKGRTEKGGRAGGAKTAPTGQPPRDEKERKEPERKDATARAQPPVKEPEDRGRADTGKAASPDRAKEAGDKGRTDPDAAAQPARFPREEADALRRMDMTAYAREVHGYNVQPDPSGQPNRFVLRRANENGRIETLEVRRAADGHWTFRDPASPYRRGDIFDLAVKEGAPNLEAARQKVVGYFKGRSAAKAKESEKTRVEPAELKAPAKEVKAPKAEREVAPPVKETVRPEVAADHQRPPAVKPVEQEKTPGEAKGARAKYDMLRTWEVKPLGKEVEPPKAEREVPPPAKEPARPDVAADRQHQPVAQPTEPEKTPGEVKGLRAKYDMLRAWETTPPSKEVEKPKTEREVPPPAKEVQPPKETAKEQGKAVDVPSQTEGKRSLTFVKDKEQSTAQAKDKADDKGDEKSRDGGKTLSFVKDKGKGKGRDDDDGRGR